jgi:hypothetical protein
MAPESQKSTLFPELAKELRLNIWEFSQEPRIVEVCRPAVELSTRPQRSLRYSTKQTHSFTKLRSLIPLWCSSGNDLLQSFDRYLVFPGMEFQRKHQAFQTRHFY